ncbi:hypothetical protein EI94DRAFT_1602907 [Lactarius quietus]|nr:hypothetical protein EI94DRAFT_1602907 [Lactarius quietus]
MASQSADSDLLEKLYDVTLSTGITPFPGPTSASASAVLDVLKHNYHAHHNFFNEKGWHNHSTHHVLSIYTLGASPEIIADTYKTAHDYLLPAIKHPGPITEKNFAEHLGDERYYTAYLAFFSEYLRDHTPNEAFERFIFSSPYNFDPDLAAATVQDLKGEGKDGKKHPQMLNRHMSVLLHPFIHIGYGFEFGIPGQVAEGLAITAVHRADQPELVPPSFFSKLTQPGILSGLTSRLSLPAVHKEKRPTFAFLRRIRDHARLSQDTLRPQLEVELQYRYRTVVPVLGDSIAVLVEEWANEWLADARTDADIEKRLEGMVEEVAWGNAIWFAARGWQTRGDRGRAFNADFFVAHLVTSSVFLLTLVLRSDNTPYPPQPLATRVMLLKAYLSTCAGFYISRGNGPLPVKEFYAATNDCLTAPPAVPGPPGAKRQPLTAPGGPWGRIIANAIAYPEEHVVKTIRSLAVFAARWGSRPAGYFAGGGDDGLQGRELLDGTIFVRAASLTLNRLGWAHESGKELVEWDYEGYYNWRDIAD